MTKRALLAGSDLDRIERAVREAGFEIVADDPDLVICYGGDGTLLGAERDYPGLPKVPLRRRADDETGALAAYARLLRRVARGEGRVTRLPKLEALCGEHRFLAVNDIIVRNASLVSAVRFRVEIDGVEHFGEIVGDGLVAATPFGSAAYYRSITNSVIHVGIGLAFNNSTEPVNHLVLAAESRIRATITRGPALLAADNSPEQFELCEGDVVEIRQSGQEAVIWEIDNLLSMESAASKNGRRLRWLHPVTQERKGGRDRND